MIYYITDHGRGHATRSVALIRKLQLYGIKIIIRNSNVVDFLQKSLPGIEIKKGVTDIGPVLNSDGISINHNESIEKISNWINNINSISSQEVAFLKYENPDLIISDVSPMPLIAANSINIPSVVISNFSWYDVLTFLPENIRLKFKEYYDLADFCLQLPLGTEMNHFKKKYKVKLIARNLTENLDEIRKLYGIKKSLPCVLFALGGSKNKISFSYDDNIQIISLNTKFEDSITTHDLSDTVEGQNLVSIADLVICKCGYGLISECLSNGTPFFYLADDSHPEQMAISNELINRGINSRISFEDIKQLHISSQFLQNIPKISHDSIDLDDTINYILKLIKN
ncbi:hypothetical protein BD31_I0472 [Candidatus Nitrosopumilus salaria BD31]|uniref:Glycosyl transferase family 28 C-terminal domain-containing protein n=1 Tax=Candidatus Nitrosopumilus salarius BD31 TaxID=859350 RepID=I3D5B8_9ARCH|nr:hypothetical protein [Candidatus Nitrosopumilus salaria]EIJ66911.1 hypothetical protein BD31_I0472 [Candidatus Nitrosopumilus salaria BD31]